MLQWGQNPKVLEWWAVLQNGWQLLELFECLTICKDESRSRGRVCRQARETSGCICFEKGARLHFGKSLNRGTHIDEQFGLAFEIL